MQRYRGKGQGLNTVRIIMLNLSTFVKQSRIPVLSRNNLVCMLLFLHAISSSLYIFHCRHILKSSKPLLQLCGFPKSLEHNFFYVFKSAPPKIVCVLKTIIKHHTIKSKTLRTIHMILRPN